MSDLTFAFEEMPLISMAGMRTALVSGAADIDIVGFYSRGHWNVVSIRLDGETASHKRSYRTITGEEDDPARDLFAQIGSVLMIEHGEAIERELEARYGGSPSAYDRRRNAREAA